MSKPQSSRGTTASSVGSSRHTAPGSRASAAPSRGEDASPPRKVTSSRQSNAPSMRHSNAPSRGEPNNVPASRGHSNAPSRGEPSNVPASRGHSKAPSASQSRAGSSRNSQAPSRDRSPTPGSGKSKGPLSGQASPNRKSSTSDGHKKMASSGGTKGRTSQLKTADKRLVGSPMPPHVLEQPLIRPRVPTTVTTLKGGTMTPENRALHAIAILADSSQQDILTCCHAVSELADASSTFQGKQREALRALFVVLPHGDRRVSLAAGRAIAQMAPRGDVEVNREARALLTHEHEHVRLAALQALAGAAGVEDADSVEAISSMLQDSSLLVRRGAVVALPGLAPKGHPMLLRFICLHNRHHQPEVRAAACRAIGKVSEPWDETALALLRDTLTSDADIGVRTQALEAIVPLTIALRDKISEEAKTEGTNRAQGVAGVKYAEDSKTREQSFAKNVSAVLSAMQDSIGSADGAFVKRAFTSMRRMMVSADEGADMVQEPHREAEGYVFAEPRQMLPLSASRTDLNTPDVIGHDLLRQGLSPMNEPFDDEEWEEEEEDDMLGAFVILDGKVVPRVSLTPRSLARSHPSPAPNSLSPLGSASKRRSFKLRGASPANSVLGSESPFRRKPRVTSAQRRTDEEAAEAAAGCSELDVVQRSGVPSPPDPFAVKYGTGIVQDSDGLFAEVPRDVRQCLGPVRLGVNGRSSAVDVLLFWRRGHIWTMDISECIVRPHAASGHNCAIKNLEDKSFVSCTNVVTQHIFPQLSCGIFRFAAGPLQRSGCHVVLFVYTHYVLEVPLLCDASCASMTVDASQPACKMTLEQALGKDFALALKLPGIETDDSLSPPLVWEDVGVDRPATGSEITNPLLEAALKKKLQLTKGECDQFELSGVRHDSFIKIADKYYRPGKIDSTSSSHKPTTRLVEGVNHNLACDSLKSPLESPKTSNLIAEASRTPSMSQSEVPDGRNAAKESYSANEVDANQLAIALSDMSDVWRGQSYCGTGEVTDNDRRIWYLFQKTHVSVFECIGETESESSRLLHAPRPIEQVIYGGPSEVCAVVGPLETVGWLGDGRWKRSSVLFLLNEDSVWEWNLCSNQVQRTFRKAEICLETLGPRLSLDRLPSQATARPNEAHGDRLPGRVPSSAADNLPSRTPSNQPQEASPADVVHRSPSTAMNVDDAAAAATKSHAMDFAGIRALGIAEISGMPMVRRESRRGPWIEREGVRPPPLHLSLDGMIPSLVDVMGPYVLVDESWADTGRPLYLHLTAKRSEAPGARAAKKAGLSYAPSAVASCLPSEEFEGIAASLQENQSFSRAPSGALHRRNAVLSRNPSVADSVAASDGFPAPQASEIGRVPSSALKGGGQGWDLLRSTSVSKIVRSTTGRSDGDDGRNLTPDSGPVVQRNLNKKSGGDLWNRLRGAGVDGILAKNSKSAEPETSTESALAIDNAVYATGLQLGESARPALFQRRASLFTANAEDVSSIDVEREKSVSRTQSQVSEASQKSMWGRLRSGASGLVLKTVLTVGNDGCADDKQTYDVLRTASGDDAASGFHGSEAAISRLNSSGSAKQGVGMGISRLGSTSSQKSAEGDHRSRGGEGDQQASFLFWRWPGSGPQDQETTGCSGAWVVADSPAAEGAAFFVESDAMDPGLVGLEASAQWQCWDGFDWAPSPGGFRVMVHDGKLNPDAACKMLMDGVDYFRGRRCDDEARETKRMADVRRQQHVQRNVISRLQSSASNRASVADRLRGIGANMISRRPSGASGGFSRRSSAAGFGRTPSLQGQN